MTVGRVLEASWGDLEASLGVLGSLGAVWVSPYPYHRPWNEPVPTPPSFFFSTPYRTSTSLNLTPLNLTQLNSILTLRGAHFGPPWATQIHPRSIQDRPNSSLDTLFFQKRDFSKKRALCGPQHDFEGQVSPRWLQERPKIDPRPL